MNKPASKLIMPKHIWDGKKKEKQKKDIEKVPQPTGYRLVLFPLKLEGKTAGGVLLTDTAIEQASIATNICKVIAVVLHARLAQPKRSLSCWLPAPAQPRRRCRAPPPARRRPRPTRR